MAVGSTFYSSDSILIICKGLSCRLYHVEDFNSLIHVVIAINMCFEQERLI